MADFRPLVLDGTQIEELNESSDRLLVRDMVSTFDSNDKLHFTANSIRAMLNNGDRFLIEDTQTSFLGKTAADCKINMVALDAANDCTLSLGLLADQDECVFNYNPASNDGTAEKDKNKKLTVMLEGLGSQSQQVVGIQTSLIGIGTHYRSAVVIPSRGNSAGNEGTKLTTYYETTGICNFSEVGTDVDAAALQLGLGLSIIKGGANSTGPTVEFVKNRGAELHGLSQSNFNALGAVQNNDVLGQLLAGGSVGAGSSNPEMSGGIAFKATQNWIATKQASYVAFEATEYVTNSKLTPLTVGKEQGADNAAIQSDSVGGKTIQLPLAPVNSTTVLCIDSNGNLVKQSSSLRYKENIEDVSLEQCQNIVENLRPVSFVYKGQTEQKYGLIAEEVEQVDNVLTAYDNDGQVESVSYSSLSVMLLKVVRDQQAQITALETRIAALEG